MLTAIVAFAVGSGFVYLVFGYLVGRGDERRGSVDYARWNAAGRPLTVEGARVPLGGRVWWTGGGWARVERIEDDGTITLRTEGGQRVSAYLHQLRRTAP